MRIRIRILDPHWKKLIRIRTMSFLYWLFLTKNNFQIFCFIFFAYFYPKTWWTIQKWRNFYNLSFFTSSDLGFRSKAVLWLIFYPLDPNPWISILLRIRIQKAKIFRIRILSTALTAGWMIIIRIKMISGAVVNTPNGVPHTRGKIIFNSGEELLR